MNLLSEIQHHKGVLPVSVVGKLGHIGFVKADLEGLCFKKGLGIFNISSKAGNFFGQYVFSYPLVLFQKIKTVYYTHSFSLKILINLYL